MSFKGKIIYLGEWVSTINKPTKHMKSLPCSICKEFKVKKIYYNLVTKEIRCTDCFDAEKQHYDYWFEYSKTLRTHEKTKNP